MYGYYFQAHQLIDNDPATYKRGDAYTLACELAALGCEIYDHCDLPNPRHTYVGVKFKHYEIVDVIDIEGVGYRAIVRNLKTYRLMPMAWHVAKPLADAAISQREAVNAYRLEAVEYVLNRPRDYVTFHGAVEERLAFLLQETPIERFERLR